VTNGGYVRLLRDATGYSLTQPATNAEPIQVYSVHGTGAVRFVAYNMARYEGTITLHTNGVIAYSQWFSDPTVGERRDFYFKGSVVQDNEGYKRGLHFLKEDLTIIQGTGTQSRLSQFVVTTPLEYQGYTHVSDSLNSINETDFTGWLQLTNGNNRLPTSTTLYLGGRLLVAEDSGKRVYAGATGAVGVLVLAGVNQELAGLIAIGTGRWNRVINQHPSAASTLTLNIASGVTNVYSGYLGGIGGMFVYPDDPATANNLNLTKTGSGTLVLQAPSNTYTGITTVQGGTLVVNADQRNSGLITVQNGAVLGGTGRVGAVTVWSGGYLSPGASPGVLTAHGDVTLQGGSVFQVELNGTTAGSEYDQLSIVAGSLKLQQDLGVRPDLVVTLGFTPSPGNSFDIVTGLSGFDWSFDGYFQDKPDGTEFAVGSTALRIDYLSDTIRLTVVPEPATGFLLLLAGAGIYLRRRLLR